MKMGLSPDGLADAAESILGKLGNDSETAREVGKMIRLMRKDIREAMG